MAKVTKKSPWFIISIFLILLTSVYVQTLTYANHDSIWLLHCTNLWLHGGQYYQDFFETNPPLVLFFYAPPEIIADWFGLDDYMVLGAYVYALIILSIALSYALLKKSDFSDRWAKWFLSVFTVVVSIVPFFWFFDRETYAIILTLPYFLLIVCRLLQKETSFNMAVLIGFLAAIGFGLKPYFLLPLIFIELYLMIIKRTIFSWWRVESLTLFLCLLFYVGIVLIFFKLYLTKVVPLSMLLYLPAFEKSSLSRLFFSIGRFDFYFGLVVCAWALFNWRGKKEFALLLVLMLGCLGFLWAYFIQSRVWYYHLYPSLAMLLLVLSAIVILLFSDLLMFNGWSRKLISKVACAFIAMVLIVNIFSTALFSNILYFSVKADKHSPDSTLMAYLNQHADHQNVLIVSDWFLQEHIRYNTHAIMVSRFPSMLLMPGIQLLQNQNRLAEAFAAKTTFMHLFMEDIARRPPVWIVIETDGFESMYAGKVVHYKFLPFLLSDARFNVFFKAYNLVAVLPYFRIYLKRGEEGSGVGSNISPCK